MHCRVPRAASRLTVRNLLVATFAFSSFPVLFAPAAIADVTITMVDFTFSPRDVTIQIGETVTWVNPDGMFHTVTNGPDSGDPEAGLLFDTYFLGDFEQTFSYAFADSGVYPFLCRFHEPLDMKGTVTVLAANGTGVPGSRSDASRLLASPNPARDETAVAFRLDTRSAIRVDVYDLTGRRIRELFHGTLSAGEQSVRWDGRDAATAAVPSGVYVIRLEMPRGSTSARVTLLR